MNYTGSLHNHSEYSNLRLRDSITRTKAMMEYAGQLGHKVLGITEHESISNAIKVEKEYKKIRDKYPDLKVIRGNEIYLCRDGLTADSFIKGEDKYFHFILLARDAEGHQQIRELSTRAWLRSYSTGKMRRVPTYYQDLIDIVTPNPGHIVASTACLGGYLGTMLLKYHTEGDSMHIMSQIENWLRQMKKLFGVGNFYLEMQPSKGDEQIYVNQRIIELSERLNIPYIITTDTHYLKKEDAPIHKAFLNSQDGEREVDSFYETTYMMGTEELESFFSYLSREQLDTAYQNAELIGAKCEDYTLCKPLKIPSLCWRQPKAPIHSIELYSWFKLIPWLETFYYSDFNGDKRLVELIIEKLKSDSRLQYKESYDEINSNLQITWESSEVNKAHWSAYFLNLQKILEVCWAAGTLVGPGRGSGVGFYLLYILDICQINPMWETTKTFSWRFLNPSRVSVLDIDTDIEGNRRAQVLQALRDAYGSNRVANVVTFGTEGSKQAIQTAARGLGIDNDVSLYIASLIPADRGKTRTLSQCFYGDEENGFDPIPLFIQQMKEYPELWNVAQNIEGLVCRVGEHAGGVIFVDEDFTNSTGLMKVPNGDIVTQFDLHDSEAASLIKIDLLSVEALDKIHICLDLLTDFGYIEKKDTLQETYESVLGIYNIERKAPKMWEMVWNHEIQALFQMEKQSGIQGIALTKPTSVDDLAVLNSVIRLMAQEKDAEQPLNKYARFKSDITQWYKEMDTYGVSKAGQKLLEPIIGGAYGICESQEKFMMLVQLPECGGFDLNFADRLRKSIAKKNPAEYDQLTKEYFETIKAKNLDYNLCNYVWNVLVATSKGYGFNASHTLAYSLVGLQEMNLAYRFPVIIWNCACLIADSGGAEIEEESSYEEIIIEDEVEEEEDKKKRARSTDYKKIATAIGKMQQAGISIKPPDINNSSYTFTPDVKANEIIFGLSGILNVGEDIISATIKNRPYSSPKDYYEKVQPKKTSMVALIKAGAFDTMMDRKLCLGWYLWETCDRKQRLTLQNMPSLIKYDLIPKEEKYSIPMRVYEFNRYLKYLTKQDPAAYDEYYTLDARAVEFLTEIGKENLITSDNLAWFVSRKNWDKLYDSYMDIFRSWLAENKNRVLDDLNRRIFKEEWDKYGKGTISAWEMEVLCYYYHEHELAHLNLNKYGIVEFSSLSEEPIVEKTIYKGGKTINLFKLDKIAGTCIAKDKAKGTVTLLTTSGVVNVKMRKEYFAIFDKQISDVGEDGKKSIKEKSWFNRGNMLIVHGMRSGDEFMCKKYASSASHQLYRITKLNEDGTVELTNERYQGGIDD